LCRSGLHMMKPHSRAKSRVQCIRTVSTHGNILETLLNTATDCNTLHQKVGRNIVALFPYLLAHSHTLQHAARCNTLQHAATRCNRKSGAIYTHRVNTWWHSATQCKTLQHTATYGSIPQHAATRSISTPCATHCNTLQHTTTRCNMLQWVICCSMLQCTVCCSVLQC